MLASYLDNSLGEGSYVLGNEAGDLDSIACALSYGYFLGKNRPLLNFPREELELRPEFVYLMGELKIPEESLLFREDLVQVEELVLVDHHTLAPDQQFLAPQVVEIIDHHPGAVPVYPRLRRQELVEVGSLSSWIAGKLHEWPEDCGRLLYSAILLDTQNGQDPHKTTPLDEKMLQVLAAQLHRTDREADFRLLQGLKESLSPEQWLQKDIKSYGVAPYRYGIASAPSFEGLAPVHIEHCREKRGYSALFLFETATKKLTLYAPDPEVFAHFLQGVPFPLLKKEPGEAHFQCPAGSSRKTISYILITS